jgi:hypothetical protein
MMSDSKTNTAATEKQEHSLEFSFRSVSSTLKAARGKEIQINRAILSLHNTGQTAVVGVVPHATVKQEDGPVHDRSEALSRTGNIDSISPGDEVDWDVYDLLLAVSDGLSSKIHLFGHKAVLNWWYELNAWTEYRMPDVATPEQTPVSRWKFRWSRPDLERDDIDLVIEVVED